MTSKDLITIFMLIPGLVWGTGMLVLLKRNKSEFVDYTIENFFWTLAVGRMGYFSGRKIARDSRK